MDLFTYTKSEAAIQNQLAPPLVKRSTIPPEYSGEVDKVSLKVGNNGCLNSVLLWLMFWETGIY
ncbi:MAG: hypothetical protein FWK04_16490 [Nostoc sp. GBBB01]|jgi:hypothetical protein|nr:hypothetical protein [Nostoc sp. GBBB01]